MMNVAPEAQAITQMAVIANAGAPPKIREQ